MTHVSELIRKIQSGQEITRKEHAAASWSVLSERLRDEVWLLIQQWISDEDIRARDVDYARMKLDALIYYLNKVEEEERMAGNNPDL